MKNLIQQILLPEILFHQILFSAIECICGRSKNENNASHDSTNNQLNFTVVSTNSRSAESTGDTENGCAASGGQIGAPRGLIVEELTTPVDEQEANRLIDQILDLQITLDYLTWRMNGIWKFPFSGVIKNALLN